MSDPYVVRPFSTIEEYKACVALQEETWGVGFSERVAPAILKVSQILGGVAAGAYDADGALVGFVFGMTGLRDGELAHWSDMLAVRPEARDHGLGRRLKWYQRDQVLGRGVKRMFWTFDPLQSRNAYLNFAKLGIVVREYVVDMYGQTDSPLHRGIGTDRCVALWLLDSERVSERAAAWAEGRPAVSPDEVADDTRVVLRATPGGAHPVPGEPDLSAGNERLGVQIPADVGALMNDDLGLARAWRNATRAAFTHYLDLGYEASDLVRGNPTSTYIFRKRDGVPR